MAETFVFVFRLAVQAGACIQLGLLGWCLCSGCCLTRLVFLFRLADQASVSVHVV